MKTAYPRQLIEDCAECRLRTPEHFCNMSEAVLRLFHENSHQTAYPSNACLFAEGQMPRGLHLLCTGKVKLSTTSREGKILILKLANAGEVLGLSAVISGTYYEVTAHTAEPCVVSFLERRSLVDALSKNGELGFRAAQALSAQFQAAYRDIHDLVLARSSEGKLAKLLLSWGGQSENGDGEIRLPSTLTHEEMGQMIGASRETVTRVLSHLKRKDFIRVEGSVLVIRNKTALEALST